MIDKPPKGLDKRFLLFYFCITDIKNGNNNKNKLTMKTKLITLTVLLLSAFAMKAQQGEIIYVDNPSPRVIGPSYGSSNAMYDFDGNDTNDIWVRIINYPWYYVQAHTLGSWQYYQHSVSHLDCFVSPGDTLSQIPDHYWLNPPETKDGDVSKGGRVIYIDGWESVDSVIIAVRKPVREGFCYGWFRLSVIGDPDNLPENNQLKVIIHDYAFCTEPNYPLRAGQTSFTWGTNENDMKSTTSIYPNPANDILFVETEHAPSLPDQSYRITNLMGQTLLSGNITAENQQIDIEELPAGMYFITFAGETQKFVVK